MLSYDQFAYANNYDNNGEIDTRSPVSDGKGWAVSNSSNHDGVWQTIFEIAVDSQEGSSRYWFRKDR